MSTSTGRGPRPISKFVRSGSPASGIRIDRYRDRKRRDRRLHDRIPEGTRISRSVSTHQSDIDYARRGEGPFAPARESDRRENRYNRYVEVSLRLLPTEEGSLAATFAASKSALNLLLRQVGNEASLLPHIVADGTGGCFAEWLVAGNKLEIGVDEDGDGYVLAISGDGRTVLNEDFDPESVSKKTLGTTRTLLRQLKQFMSPIEKDVDSLGDPASTV